MKPRLSLAFLIALLSASAAVATPVEVVRELFARYAAGDARGAAELFVDGDAFLRQHGRRLERRCMRVERLAVDADPHDPSRVETTHTLALRTGDSPEWFETARSRFTLQHDGTRWRIAAWSSRDAEAVEQFGATIVDVPEAQTTAAVQLLATRAVELTNQRRFAEADALSDAAMRMAARLGDPRSMGAAAASRGTVLRIVRLGDFESAAELAREALWFAEASGDPDLVGRALYRLARTLEEIDGAPDLDSLERAMSLVETLDDPSLAPLVATHLARAHESRGQSRQAFHYAQLAAKYAEETTDASARINAWLMLGAAYLWIGNSDAAARYYRAARDLSRESGFSGGEAVAIGGLAVSAHRPGEAIRIVEDGLRTVHGFDRQWLLRSRANLLAHDGRLDEAEQAVEEAAAAAPPTTEARQGIALLRAQIAENRQHYEAALRHLQDARGTGGADRTARLWSAQILSCLGRPSEALTMLEELYAEPHYSSAIDPRTFLFSADRQGLQRMLVKVLLDHSDVNRALEFVEEMKAISLRRTLETRGEDRSRGMTAQERKQEAALESRLRALQRALYAGRRASADTALLQARLTDARAALLEFRQNVFSAHVSSDSVATRRPFRLEELPPELDGVTFVAYVSHEDVTFVFAIEPKRGGRRRVTAHRILIREGELGARVRRFASLIEQRNLRSDEAGAEMYDLLLGPLAPVLRDATTLGIIPDSLLWHLPFHVLGPRGGAPLIERMPVFYAPSLRVLAAARAPRAAGGTVLALGNPNVSAKTASLYRSIAPDAITGPIPEAESEVRAISRIYGRQHSRVYIGNEARESVLKREAPRYDVLHIATHGLMHQQSPMFSSLLLTTTPDEADDGLLEAREIAEMELDADLAVLSACETGKAEELNGDGVIGLSWALLAAGARTTVVSQWKAQSAVTAQLMIEFHRRLARGRSKAQALREAQLAVRAQRAYRHPFYWAPFVVIGAP
jgi:CHAT domain-containing protein